MKILTKEEIELLKTLLKSYNEEIMCWDGYPFDNAKIVYLKPLEILNFIKGSKSYMEFIEHIIIEKKSDKREAISIIDWNFLLDYINLKQVVREL